MSELVIMIGIQGSGKSSFCKMQLSDYVRINLDTLRTRHNEDMALADAFSKNENIVIDNTNVTADVRKKYIDVAKTRGYRIVGYFMKSVLSECIERNGQRSGKECIPEKAIVFTSNRMELPDYAEGFDELYFVSIAGDDFNVEKWKEQI